MTLKNIYAGLRLIVLTTFIISCVEQTPKKQYDTDRILAYEVNPKKEQLHFYWKNEQGEI